MLCCIAHSSFKFFPFEDSIHSSSSAKASDSFHFNIDRTNLSQLVEIEITE